MSNDRKPTALPPGAEVPVPRNSILSKVRKQPGSANAMLQAADASVADMRGEYERWLGEDLRKLGERCAALRSADASARQQLASDAARVAHDIKGQGGSFGYQLITDIAASLNHYLHHTPSARLRDSVIVAHVEALNAIAAMRIRGNGGEAGSRIVDTLAKAISDGRS